MPHRWIPAFAGMTILSKPQKARTIFFNGEYLPDTAHILCNRPLVEQLARLVFTGRITDFRRTAAKQYDRLMAAFLEPAQDHDLHETTDMQAGGGAVKADIGDQRAVVLLVVMQQCVKRRCVGALMDEAALLHDAEKFGSAGHIRIVHSRMYKRGVTRTQLLCRNGGLLVRKRIVTRIYL